MISFKSRDFKKFYNVLWVCILIAFLNLPASAQFTEYSHPELKWQSFDTEHFTFHFHQGTKRTAFLAAKIAEDVYPAVTGLYDYRPPVKIHIIIKDTDDYANGAAYFFNNKMEILATNMDYVMRGTKNWLRDVMTHEFTHIVSIQKTIKSSVNFPYGFFQWFGYENERRKDVVRGFPNVLVNYPISSINMPVWFAEGVAQQQNDRARFDYRDPHREMVIRDRILNEQFLTYNEMSVFGKTSHGNESSYNLGFSFSKYLADRFGEKILSDITAISSKWSSYTFDGILEKATGIETDSLYKNWKDSLTTVYKKQTETIRKNEVVGSPIEKEGFANLYPAYSPDGKKIAYLSNKGGDYWGPLSLELYSRENKSVTTLEQNVAASSISWSPDGRFIAYSAKDKNEHKSSFNDLFLYDLKNDESVQLTNGLRGKNPDFSHDGKKLIFVTSTDGLHQLNVYYLPENFENDKAECAFDVETGQYYSEYLDGKDMRRVEYIPGKIEQILTFPDGRLIYHPKWSNDDTKIVFGTSVEYGRNLGVYDVGSGSFSMLMEAEEELRYPVFQPGSDWLYYSASTTGIYNLYRWNFNTGQKELLTNVTGGAFMPSVAQNGDIVYALYDSIGYKIYELKDAQSIDPKLAIYDEHYISSIPQKNFDDSKVPEFTVHPYKNTFTNLMILPRLFIDYNTFKPGFYLASSDVLDKMNLVAGAAVNTDFDYDLYGYANYRNLGPTIFAEIFNINANIDDTLEEDLGGYVARGRRNVNFNLLQFGAGITISPFEKFDITFGYIRSIYRAKLDPVTLKDPAGNNPNVYYVPTIRYKYLDGHKFEAKFLLDNLKADRFSDVNPSQGSFTFLRVSRESSDFLSEFSTERQLGLEDFKNYSFNSVELNHEQYFKNPLIKSHAIGFNFKGGFIDTKVDSFFNYFAGGILGLKGYPFYSIEGRNKLIGTITYRFPLHRHLDLKLGHLQFDKLYLGFFYEYGDAFNGNHIDFKGFKRDVGLELRLDSFSYNLFPTRLFFQAAWPIDKITNRGVVYPREWRYYFGLLFEFDLRERMDSLLGSNSVSSQINGH